MPREPRSPARSSPAREQGSRRCSRPARAPRRRWQAGPDPSSVPDPRGHDPSYRAWSARDAMLDLVGLLERRPVDPGDERLGGAADRALADRVPAPLVPVVAVRIVLVDLGRGDGGGLTQ